MARISAERYAALYGPTVGDQVRLGDTDLWIEIEEDRTVGGEEAVFGGGKSIRESMAQGISTRVDGAPDTVITNAIVLDHWGVVRADVGLRDGRIVALGKAGNPDMQDGIHPALRIGPSTDVIAGEGRILTAGAFDTHVHQGDTHGRLITYVSDAVSAFLRDMERIGRADDVVLMAFSEFGRRVPENANLGTDHGTAGPMFLAGRPVRGGQYSQPVSLSGRDADDNLRYTTDFRRVYASVAEGWLGVPDSSALLRGRFETFPIFG